MTKLAAEFMAFLLEIHKSTGQISFEFIEYQDFNGYEDAITELINRGLITRFADVLGTIQVNVPQNRQG